MSASAPGQTVFSIGYDFHLGNGDNGNVFGITNYRDNSRNQSFTYDSLNRLTSAQNAGTNCAATTINGKTEYWGNSYNYDAWGNLLAKSVTKCSAENLSVTALANNQLSGYGYDAAGNMMHDATSGWNYSYDQENRITGAAGYTYTYDGDGNRVEKSNGSTGTLYWYLTPGIVAESDLSGNLQSEYVFFAGERVARKDFPLGAVSYYFSDHLKTAAVITDAAGNIKEDEDYYPWGGELQFVNNDSNHYKFTGKERDSETGLDYFGARYYSNGLGRFITPDWAAKATEVPYAEFADPQSLNLYSYVRNVPTTKVDADGHQGEEPDLAEMFKGGLNRLKAMALETAAIVINSGGNPDFHLKVDTGALAPQNDDQWLGGAYTEAATWAVPMVAEELIAEKATVQIVEEVVPQTFEPTEGIYEFEDATAAPRNYVGQSENMPRRIPQHEASGKLAKGTKVTKTEVKGGKTAREIAEHKRIQELGGVRSKPGSKTSNIRNPIGKKRQHLLKKDDKKS